MPLNFPSCLYETVKQRCCDFQSWRLNWWATGRLGWEWWNEPGGAEFFLLQSSNLRSEITDSRRPRALPGLQKGFHFGSWWPGKDGATGLWGHSDRKTVRAQGPMLRPHSSGIRTMSSPCDTGMPPLVILMLRPKSTPQGCMNDATLNRPSSRHKAEFAT